MKKGKLYIMIGVAGAGKSTYAKKLSENNKNIYIVNRDRIREELFGYTEENVHEYYICPPEILKVKEKMVTNFENDLIKNYLKEGKSVIVDATHLRESFIKRFFEMTDDITFIVFNTSLEECIRRQNLRVRKVPKEVIKNQYELFKEMKEKIKKYKKPIIEINQ